MYICERCERTYEEESAVSYDSDHINVGCGVPLCVRNEAVLSNCSYCGGYLVEADECVICGEYFLDDGNNGVCNECLEYYATFENAIRYGYDEKEEVKLNSYLLHEFSTSQIEAILQRELEDAIQLNKELSYEEFCLQDKWSFADWVKK